jgi:CheY-like chemotaxis protein
VNIRIPNDARFAQPLRGQLVILLHRHLLARQALGRELVRLGYAVLTLGDDAELETYLDGAESYDARVAFPDLLIADEHTLGLAGLRRLVALRESAAPVPIVLLSALAMPSVIESKLCRALHIVAMLAPPFSRAQLAITLALALPPSSRTDDAARPS